MCGASDQMAFSRSYKHVAAPPMRQAYSGVLWERWGPLVCHGGAMVGSIWAIFWPFDFEYFVGFIFAAKTYLLQYSANFY